MKANSNSLPAVVEKAGVATVALWVDRSFEVATSIAIDAKAELASNGSTSARMTTALAEEPATLFGFRPHGTVTVVNTAAAGRGFADVMDLSSSRRTVIDGVLTNKVSGDLEG